jgi:hypothetical protein
VNNQPPPPKNDVSVFFSVYLFFAEALYWKLFLFFFKLLEHRAVWLEDLFQLSNNFDAPIH